MKYIVLDIETTGLNALYGDRITAIGCKIVGQDEFYLISEEDESSMLSAFYNWFTQEMDKDTVVIGHNLKKFDIPFLWIRFLKCGFDAPEFLFDIQQIDTFEITNKWVSLDDMAKILNCPVKNGNGLMAIKLWEANDIHGLLAYLKRDLEVTEAVFLKLKELKTLEV